MKHARPTARRALLGTILTLMGAVGNAVLAQPCLGDYTFTASPPPQNGVYDCGQTVTFCLTVNTWNTTNANWLHGVVPMFGAGWDLSTLVPGAPPSTVGTSGGTWGWYNSETGTSPYNVGTQGPGFFFDLDNDGNPGDNFGDYATAGPWTFCFTISVASGVDCVNGADLSVSANTFGDSETGSWGGEGCGGDVIPILSAQVMSCPTAGIPAPQALCNDQAPLDLFTTLGGTPDPTGTWLGPDGPLNGVIDPASSPSGDYTYIVTPTNNCPVSTATIPVTINTLPNAGSDGSLALCETDPATDLFASLGGTPDAGGTWVASGNAVSGTVDPATAANDVFVYTVTGQAPCPNASASVSLTVDHMPDPGTSSTLSLCPEGAVQDLFSLLGGNPSTGGVWTDPNGAVTTGSFAPRTDLPGDYTYTVSGTGACAGQQLTAVIGTTVFTTPDASFTVEPDHGCTPLDVELQLKHPDDVVSAQWKFGNGDTGSGTDVTYTYEDPGTFGVYVFITDANGCVDSLMLSNLIRVYPPPSALFHYTPFPPFTTDDTRFTFSAYQLGIANYLWQLNDLEMNGDHISYQFPYQWAGSYPVCLTVTDSILCTAMSCDTIVINDPLSVYVPNAFTPDGDGVNDVWSPSLVSVDPKDLSLQVFDRWGEMVFESKGPDLSWNGGKGNAGSVLPQGVYTYKLELRNIFTAERKQYLGHVSLLK